MVLEYRLPNKIVNLLVTILSQKTSSKTRFLKSIPLQIRQLIFYSRTS
jgi:hypothetical protein